MRLPDDTQRHGIVGQTGSGKTVAELWALEKRSWHKMPWTLIDAKRDPTIRRIPRLEEYDVRESPPKQSGLYVVRPLPDEEEEVNQLMWRIWQREKHGIAADEVYMLGRFTDGFQAIMTQGRSKRIPVIGCSQRPSFLNPFYLDGLDFHQVLHVPNPNDFKKLSKWIPGLQPTDRNFHSQYYDVARDELTYCSPVPDEEEILDRFDRKMPHRVRLLRGFFENAPGSKPKRRLG